MGAFGDKLRREREMRGVTLAEMSESTKISKRWLQALEDEQFDVLPGGVFNRGFVRSYARFLGIHEDQTVADYVAASNEQPPPEDRFPLDVYEKEDSPPLNPKRSFLPIALAIVALVLVVGGWTWWVKHKPQGWIHPSQVSQHKATGQASPSTTKGAAASSNASPDAGNKDSQTTSSAPEQKLQLPAGNGKESFSGSAGSSGQENVPAEADQKAKQSSPQPTRNLTKSFTVFIKAKENSWISIVADGKTRWAGILDANRQRSVKAGKELVLRTGNAGGLEVSYNGQPLGAVGKEKEVRTLTFNTEGLQQ